VEHRYFKRLIVLGWEILLHFLLSLFALSLLDEVSVAIVSCDTEIIWDYPTGTFTTNRRQKAIVILVPHNVPL
jgi:hypothetical protein